jgi:hypothetical protein
MLILSVLVACALTFRRFSSVAKFGTAYFLLK